MPQTGSMAFTMAASNAFRTKARAEDRTGVKNPWKLSYTESFQGLNRAAGIQASRKVPLAGGLVYGDIDAVGHKLHRAVAIEHIETVGMGAAKAQSVLQA